MKNAKKKKKTSNLERRTSNAERRARQGDTPQLAMRAAEEPTGYGRGRRTSQVELGKQGDTQERNAYDLEDRLLDYAVRVLRLVDALPPSKAGRHVADQLLRCGTSPLANHGEVQGAESRKDFIHKLAVCLKEIRETHRWLRLIHRVPLVEAKKIEPLLAETEALLKIFRASIRTARKNAR